MSPEEKIEMGRKLIAEAEAEIAAKKRNWPEKIEPGMLFRCPIGTFLIRYRSHGPLGPINDWDLVEIFTGRYLSGEGGKFSGQEHEFTYLGRARDLIKIADDAHEPTGAELVGNVCQVSLSPINKPNDGIRCLVTSFDPIIGYRTKEGENMPWKYARLAR